MRYIFLALLITNIVAGYAWHAFAQRQARDADAPQDPDTARLILALERNPLRAPQSEGEVPLASSAVGVAPVDQDARGGKAQELTAAEDTRLGPEDGSGPIPGPQDRVASQDDEQPVSTAGNLAPQSGTEPVDAESGAPIGDGEGDGRPVDRPVSLPENTGADAAAAPAYADPDQPVGCVGVGPLPGSEDARELVNRLSGPGIAVDVVEVEVSGRESFWVHITPRASDEEARSVVSDLARLGIDSFVIRDPGPMRNGVSLGVFRERAGAEKLAQRHADLGMPIAIGSVATPASKRTLVRVRGIALQDEGVRARLLAALAGLGLDAAIEEC